MKNNIENIFREKLSNASTMPPKSVWGKIAKNPIVGSGGTGFSAVPSLVRNIFFKPIFLMSVAVISTIAYFTIKLESNQKPIEQRPIKEPIAKPNDSIPLKWKEREGINPVKNEILARPTSPTIESKRNQKKDTFFDKKTTITPLEKSTLLPQYIAPKTSLVHKDQSKKESLGTDTVEKNQEKKMEKIREIPPIPNVITPYKMDGYNDKFVLDFDSIDLEKFRLLIIDWNGELIFETNNPNESWDGKNKHHQLVPQGNYIYQLAFLRKGESEEEIKQGKLNVR
ncbi:MAG: gliding motility-associated C-terminal domain-containing protein [Bacteroidota bacterium]|nr:gliding motility-associated C-terminal domain-containing protein [Bacteroidota bacterium]